MKQISQLDLFLFLKDMTMLKEQILSPVGYLEGIYVKEEYRRKGIGQKLLNFGTFWVKEKGCKEFASDCEIDNIESLSFHTKMGFLEVSRNIHFNKQL